MARILVALSVLWAALALTVQVFAARGGGRRDYSRRVGSSGKGVFYNFTVAMMPAHKESVSRHPVKFAVGVVMHVGVIAVLLLVALSLVSPALAGRLIASARPLFAVSLLAGLYLLLRRVSSPTLRAMNTPDDYIATLASCGLLALAILDSLTEHGHIVLLIYSALLLLYLPLGKLRHAVFFFVARGDYGRRLGYRGVYPPAPAGSE